MRLAALCSGGKDSSYALWLASQEGHEVAWLVTMIPEREDSWMFHYPNIHLMDLFAECSNLPLVRGETEGVKEKEVEDLKARLSELKIDGVISGAVASTYQKERVERVCKELGLTSITPLWNRDPLELLQEILEAGFEVMIMSASAEGLDEEWLGRKIDDGCIQDLKKLHEDFGINPAGEGGEYETLVLDAPFFKKRINLIKTRKIWEIDSGRLLVEEAETLKKT